MIVPIFSEGRLIIYRRKRMLDKRGRLVEPWVRPYFEVNGDTATGKEFVSMTQVVSYLKQQGLLSPKGGSK